MNNLKNIREIYGITQDEIAKAINVNRATISNWENQEDKKASNSSLEKLSLFYGIGPEFFYEEELNDTVREMLIQNAKRQKQIEKDKIRSAELAKCGLFVLRICNLDIDRNFSGVCEQIDIIVKSRINNL